MPRFDINRNNRGQAMTEMVLIAPVLTLLFWAILYFGHMGLSSFKADMAARNQALLNRGKTDMNTFHRHIDERADRIRFELNYQTPLHSSAPSINTLDARNAARVNPNRFPALLHPYQYESRFSIERPGQSITQTDPVQAAQTIQQELFGE
ncbi:MAG: hypothetical protein A2293_10785 [Elusimicrobia bacterium RIFOXYB2_FULL_49_7]|nr:MAG: hypothetical protein A2293_10785 [Elusimicrobia bacterium RIFOXYB2_FULL_49_7]